jgi:undecaprenyl-diphosphatase
MSTSGVTVRDDGIPASPMRRTLLHLWGWIGALCGPTRATARDVNLPGKPIPVAVALVSLIVAIGATMAFVDAPTSRAVASLPGWLLEAFAEITDFGWSGWLLWPTGLALLALAALMRPALGRTANLVAASLAVRLGFVFLAVAIPGLAVSIVKRLIGRVRPSALGPFSYVPFSWRPDYASMPSGHSTAVFAAALAIGAVWPEARLAAWACAVLIAISRVVVSAHYPSDVLAGAVVGICAALAVRRWFAGRRMGFVLRRDGVVQALPGPSGRRLGRLAVSLLGRDGATRQ